MKTVHHIILLCAVAALLVLAGCGNEPPTVRLELDAATVYAGMQLSIQAHGEDSDWDQLEYTWTIDGVRQSYNGSWYVLNTSPWAPDGGNVSVTVEVRDERGETARDSMLIHINPNHVPTLTVSQSDLLVTLNGPVTCTASTTDADGDPVTCHWQITGLLCGSSMPTSFTGPSCTLNPDDFLENGTAIVTCTAMDSKDAETTVELSVPVDIGNRRPAVTLSADKLQVMKGETINLSAETGDPDGDKLTFQWEVNGSSFSGSGSTLRLATSLLPTTGGKNSFTATVRVTDPRGAWSSDRIELTVIENRPPSAQFSCRASKPYTRDSDLTFRQESTDPDGDRLTYRWYMNDNLVYTGSGDYTPSSSAVRLYPLENHLKLVVTDPYGETSSSEVYFYVYLSMPKN